MRRDQHLLDLPNRFGLIIDDDLEGERLTLRPADRMETALLCDLIGEVRRGEPGREKVVGTGDDLDLTNIAAGDIGIEHVGDGLDQGGEFILGVIAELRGAVAARQSQ